MKDDKTPTNFQGVPGLRNLLPTAIADLAAELGSASDEARLQALRDTRDLHRRLFWPLLPPALRHAAGTYRGTSGTDLEELERAVFITRQAPGLRGRHQCTAAAEVGAAMLALADRIKHLWHRSAPDHDQAYADLADVTHGFLSIHPYMDGNGHVFRLILPVLGRRLGLQARSDWTLHPRPYDHVMSLCLQWYPHHPALLACYLRRWFDACAMSGR